ncbi:hypothetical protein JKP88DRAFT_256067 [Tribonema minus]|uniref:Uncharacterized protein n=1 Tax=Tribonema minus TaxID=303371 RepID=A0A835YX32_9STRA|nr:hypothetical protein JKP88DRAFT_256067 [Tribonema minus]
MEADTSESMVVGLAVSLGHLNVGEGGATAGDSSVPASVEDEIREKLSKMTVSSDAAPPGQPSGALSLVAATAAPAFSLGRASSDDTSLLVGTRTSRQRWPAAAAAAEFAGGGWRSSRDAAARKKVMAGVTAYLQQRRSDSDAARARKIPRMASYLEDALYRGATSLREYADARTLRARLVALTPRLERGGGGTRRARSVRASAYSRSDVAPRYSASSR